MNKEPTSFALTSKESLTERDTLKQFKVVNKKWYTRKERKFE